jgi:hypothetical protein
MASSLPGAGFDGAAAQQRLNVAVDRFDDASGGTLIALDDNFVAIDGRTGSWDGGTDANWGDSFAPCPSGRCCSNSPGIPMAAIWETMSPAVSPAHLRPSLCLHFPCALGLALIVELLSFRHSDLDFDPSGLQIQFCRN